MSVIATTFLLYFRYKMLFISPLRQNTNTNANTNRE